MKAKPTPDDVSQARIIARVVRDMLKADAFETLADLTDALKVRLGRYRIHWTNDDISDAFRWIGSNHPLTQLPPPTNAHVERPDEGPRPTREEAVDIVRGLMDRKARDDGKASTPPLIKTFPPVDFISQREADRRKALEMTLRQVQESIARCDALEAALVEPGDEREA